MRWAISREALAAWCRDILAKYPKEDIDLFIIRLGGKPPAPSESGLRLVR